MSSEVTLDDENPGHSCAGSSAAESSAELPASTFSRIFSEGSRRGSCRSTTQAASGKNWALVGVDEGATGADTEGIL